MQLKMIVSWSPDILRIALQITLTMAVQPRNQLVAPWGAKSFLKGGQFFKLCPIVLKYVQHILPGGEKFSRGASPSLRPLVTGLWQFVLQAASDLSVNWFWSFRISRPQWLTISQGRLCDLALMRIERDETAKAYFDKIITGFASIKARSVLF